MTKDVEVGDIFTGRVVKTTTFGAFVELTKGTDGLLHISNLKPGGRAESVEDVVNRGDEVTVRVVEVNKERGRIGLRLADDPEIEGKSVEELSKIGTGDGRPGGDRGRGGRRPRWPRHGARRAGAATEKPSWTELAVSSSTRSPSSTRGSGWSPRTCRRCARSRSGSGSGSARATSTRTRPASRTSSSTCCSRARRDLTAEQIAQVFDAFGADINAATSKETTVLYAHFLDEHLEEAFGVMADMLLRSTYADIDSEREVVLEEIAMYEDEPQDKVHDVLSRGDLRRPSARPAGDRPRGGDLLAERRRDRDLPRRPLRARRASSSRPPGTSSTTRSSQLARGKLEPPSASSDRDAEQSGAARHARARWRSTRRRPSSTTSASAARASSATTSAASRSRCSTRCSAARPRRASSRRCGRSAASPTRSTRGRATTATPASSAIYVGTRQDNVARGDERDRRRARPAPGDAVTDEELARAREHVKGRIVLSMESTANRMHRLGRSVLTGMPLLSLDEMIARLDAVDREQIQALAREFYVPESLSAAAIGRDESVFREALGVGQLASWRPRERMAAGHDPGRRVRRRRAHGPGGLRGGRGGRRPRAGRPRRSRARHLARVGPRRARVPTWSSTSRFPTPSSATRACASSADVHAVVGTTGHHRRAARRAASSWRATRRRTASSRRTSRSARS